MSLTSYRAAPPRDARLRAEDRKRKSEVRTLLRAFWRRGSVGCLLFSVFRCLYSDVCILMTALCGPGGDLLSRVLRQSTIGAEAFDGRVRDGIGSDRLAKATRPAKDGAKQWSVGFGSRRPPKAASATRAGPDGPCFFQAKKTRIGK